MTNQPKCPSASELEQFVLGQIDDSNEEFVGRHLSSCPRCVGTLLDLRVQDTLIETLQATGGVYANPEPDQVASLIQRVRGLPSPTRNSGDSSRVEATTLPPTGDPNPESGPEAYDFLSPPQQPDELGRLGPYRVLKVLGTGGMGVVFLADDPQLERHVALKAMKPVLAASHSAHKRFLREARAVAKVENEHIVHIYQVAEDRGVPFLAMQLLQGETLEDRLQREAKLPLADVLRIGRETAQGLVAAHAHGLMHRDIKPANIFLSVVRRPSAVGSATTDDGPRTADEFRVKLLDFGLARGTDDQSNLTQQGAIAGTPAYMAPEQASGEAVDHRCDLFSLGCLMYRMSTGQQPFPGANNLKVLLAVMQSDPRPLKELNPDAPAALADLVMKLLAKRPEDRPQSAREVVAAIENIERALTPLTVPQTQPVLQLNLRQADSANVSQSETATFPAAPRTPRRWPRIASVAAAIVPAFLGVTIYRIQTDKGTLVVEIIDEAVEAKLRKNGLTIQDKATGRTFTINAAGDQREWSGDYKLIENQGLKLTVLDDAGLELATNEFKLTRDGKVRVRVTLGSLTDSTAARPPQTRSTGNVQRHALRFGGEPSHVVQVPTLKLQDYESYTLEAYLTPEQAQFTKHAQLVGINYQTALVVQKNNRWAFYSYTPPSKVLVAQAPFEPGRRDHVAGVRDGKQLRLYVNGKLQAQIEAEKEPSNSPQARVAGFALGGQAFVGLLSEVHISKFARYQQDFTPETRFTPDANTVALYHFDEAQGDLLKDSSGNAHHGKIVGAKWVNAGERADDPDRRAAEWVLSIGGQLTVNDEKRWLTNISELPSADFQLTAIRLDRNPQVTDAGLASFKGCRHLVSISLAETLVSDVGLANFQDCTKLWAIGLGANPRVTDAGLAYLKNNKELVFLYLYGTQTTDAGLANFRDCPKLKWLDLVGTKVSDSGLVHFRACKDLETVTLGKTQVTDDGLENFQACPKLQTLHLSYTRISDAGLERLSGLTALRQLELVKTNVTAQGVNKLHQTIPRLRIEWDGGVLKPIETDSTPDMN